jgi:hypothetical protein
MKSIETLQAGITTLESQIQEIRKQRWEAEQAFNEKLTTSMSKFFRGVVSEDVVVTATSHSISFKMLDDTNYLREIFQIYLRENYTRERELPYKEIQLSYYATGAGSDFELTRLENLGRVASIVKGMSSELLEKVNTLAIEFNKEIKEKNFLKQIYEMEDEIRTLRSFIRGIEKDEVKAKIFSEEGINFEKSRTIQMKHNYSPTIKNIKLVEVSKSGKKAKAIFTFAHGDHNSYEENVNVVKILEQVI